MIKNVSYIFVLLLMSILFFSSPAYAQPVNLLENPYADDDTDYWRSHDDALIEECDGNPCFVVRNGGSFVQEIEIYEDDIGKYAVLTALVSSERINADGSITGLPYLYGYMMDAEHPEASGSSAIHFFLSVPIWYNNIIPALSENEWVPIWRTYPVRDNTTDIRFFLNQAQRQGEPHNGSAARFDDLGIYLFDSESEAQAFIYQLYFQ